MWENLLLSEAAPAPGNAETLPEEDQLEQQKTSIKPYGGDFKVKDKVSRWKTEVGSSGNSPHRLLSQSLSLQPLAPSNHPLPTFIQLPWSLVPSPPPLALFAR